MDAERIGGNVKRARLDAGLTQEALAQKAGVSVFTVSRWERGATRRIDLTILSKLAGALGTPTAALLGEDT